MVGGLEELVSIGLLSATVYLIVILDTNYLRQAIMPAGTVPEWAVVLIVASISVTLFAVTTAVYTEVTSAVTWRTPC